MSITHLTFVDIECVPELEKPFVDQKNYTQSEILFAKRFDRKITDEYGPLDGRIRMDYNKACSNIYEREASLYAEFGKIVAISIGKMVVDKETPNGVFYIRSLTGRDEATLLKQATDSFTRAGGTMVAHNGLEFDFPYLMRRYMINGLPMPPQLNVAGVKPWDVKLEDTMKMWSGTQWNYKVSLEFLCHVLGIPSPKQDISGADVAQIYWNSFKPVENELPFDTESKAMKKIGDYCAGDVLACANAYCRMKGLPLIENVEYV